MARQKKAAAQTKATAAKKAYIFFNCDGEKTQESMNVFYNHVVYHDTVGARKKLWEQIESEVRAGKVQLAEETAAAAREAVLKGEPTDASQYLVYGAVQAFDFI